MEAKKIKKTYLLLSPQELGNTQALIQIMKMEETPKGLVANLTDPDLLQLNRVYHKVHQEAKEKVAAFSKIETEKRMRLLESKFKSVQAGTTFEKYYPQALMRELHTAFRWLKPFTGLFTWYHKVWQDKKTAKTAPCLFSQYTPSIAFELTLTEKGFLLEPFYIINGQKYASTSFQRFAFLIESGNEYFILNFNDYKTLEWLNDLDPEQFAFSQEAFLEHVIIPLEANYSVNRNDLIEESIIDVQPVHQILLKEISNAFLYFEPQWHYDGFVVEGPYTEKVEVKHAGKSYFIKRNQAAEKAFLQQLSTLHPNFTRQLNGNFYLSFADAQKKQWFLKTYHQLLEQDIQVLGMDLLTHFRYSPFKPETTINIVNNNENNLTVTFSLHFGKESIAPKELQKMLYAGQKAVLLKDGSLGILHEEWLQQYGTLLRHGKINDNTIIIARWMALTEGNDSEQQLVLKPAIKIDWWSKWQQWQQQNHSLINIPSNIQATLRPYQQKGFEWLVLLSEVNAGACLADDMGLGKTLQTICFMAYRQALFPNEKQLIICPASLVFNWQQELQKFAPHLLSLVYHGGNRDFDELSKSKTSIIITTYGTMRADIDQLATLHFDVVVIDESHNIKNPTSQITRAVNQLIANMRIALSGTPVMNNTFDLYAQLSFLLPGMFGNREFFKREYADAIDRDRDPDKIKALQRITQPFILRRTKEQVATDLPEKVESILWCEMGTEQRMAYESIKENIKQSIFLDVQQNGFNKGKLGVINGLLKLRQACNSSELVKGENIFNYDSIKTNLLIGELNQLVPQHKVLVFSQFTGMLDILAERLQKEQLPFERLDGSTPLQERQALVNRFQSIESTAYILLISLKAGNAGLNLTAADYVFLFDPWWNTAVQQQAIDRTHRIGQTKSVFAYKMICKDSIEEKIIQLQDRKHKLAQELIGEEEGFVKSLSEDDLAFLFS
jgi:SNF2 family DNA or RNA helicase